MGGGNFNWRVVIPLSYLTVDFFLYSASPPYSADCEYTYFWKWTRFSDYCLFVLLLFLVGGIITVLLLNVTVYVELLGFASLLLEACLGVPQFWRNFSNKSTEGMRSENA